MLELSVTELAYGAAGGAPRGGAGAAWLGQTLHAEYQARAAAEDPAFEAEVALAESLVHRDWRVTLRGRADGVRGEGGGWLVEELKSLAGRDGPAAGAFRLQAVLYARMLARARGGAARAELVFLGGDEPLREAVELAPDEVARALADALDACIAEIERAEAARAAWRAAATGVRFPFPALRPGQAEIVAAVEGALARGEQLLVEAGTGSGKTAAVLTPALRCALAEGRRLYVLTASTLQQHLAVDTLRRLAPGGLPFAARLRARARLCAGGEAFCREPACGLPASPALVARCFDAEGLALPDAARALGSEAGVCPYALQLAAAERALVTVCDLNYAVDPAVALPALRDPARLRDSVLVIDEVHQLPERAREALSTRIDGARVREAAEAAALGGTPLHREVRNACETLHALLAETLAHAGAPPEGGWCVHEPARERLAALSRGFERLALAALRATQGAAGAGPFAALLDVVFALGRFLRIGAEREPGFVALAGRAGGEPQLEQFCRDPSPALARLLGGCHALVGCSATLSPPEWFEALLGLDRARAARLSLPAADPGARRAVVIDPGVTTTREARPREARRLAKRLAALAAAVPGNCLALFPSHAFLDAVRAELPAGARRVRFQARGGGEAERAALLAELRRADDVLLLALAGGALAEGVDYAGARLGAVAVLGPCLPALDAKRALLAEHFAERFERGFELAFAVPGMIRVVQSAGRLLRGDGDRGVIALYDRRFLREPYRSLLPADWTRGRAPEELVGDPAEVARLFFAER
jgi:DNA excision repair protein ERCC-2